MPLAVAGEPEASAGRPTATAPTSAAATAAPDPQHAANRGPAGQETRPAMKGDPSGGRGRDGRRTRGSGPPHLVDRPTSLAFDAEGRLLGHDVTGLRVWPAGPRAVQGAPTSHGLPPSPPPMSLSRTADGRITALLRASSVYLWRGEAPDRLIPVIPPPRPEGTANPSPTPSAPATARGPARPAMPGADGAATFFRAIQIAPRGDRLYLVNLLGRLHIWDLNATPGDTAVHAVEPDWGRPPVEGIVSLALRSDGAVLAAGDRTGTVTLIGTPRLSVLGSIRPAADAAGTFYSALAFSPDGGILAIGSQQGSISLYSVAAPVQPRPRFHLPGHHGLVTNLAFDPPGTRLASATWTDPLVEVWDLDLIGRELADLGLAEDPRVQGERSRPGSAR